MILSPLPCWEHLSPEDQKEKIAELVREIEEEAAAPPPEFRCAIADRSGRRGGGLSRERVSGLPSERESALERGRRINYKATTDSDVVNTVAAEGAKSRQLRRSGCTSLRLGGTFSGTRGLATAGWVRGGRGSGGRGESGKDE